MSGFLFKIALIMILISGICNCSPSPYAKTNRVYKKQARAFAKVLRQRPKDMQTDSVGMPPWWVGTTNFNLRKPNFVIIHHTSQGSCDETFRTFTLTRAQVSAHYVICKDGTIHHMLNDYFRAWHGGVSKWGNLTDINSISIGIELDNNGVEPFPGPQISSLLVLLDTLKRKYAIPAPNFIGHADVAPMRKNDPNIYFPWKVLSNHGFGLWYGDTCGITVPDVFNNLLALRIIGYDTRDSIASIVAFKRHFVQDTIPRLNAGERKILYILSQRFE
jgi:N-acetylmuramoyl-L-alanine amidase